MTERAANGQSSADHAVAEHVAISAAMRRLLALSLTPPRAETLDETAALAGALADLPDAPGALAELAAAFAAADPVELSAEYERLFGGDVRLPPYEGSYEVDPFRQGRQMADVSGFYAAFGASAHGSEAERPDHAGAELEFLAYLGLRRLEALDTGDEAAATRCAETEEEFLREHAGRWLPVFFARLGEESAHPVYRALAPVGRDAMTAELAARGIVVDPLPTDRRPRTAVEEDELTCAAGDEAVLPLVPAPGRTP